VFSLRRLWLRGLRRRVIVNPAFAAAKPTLVERLPGAVIAGTQTRIQEPERAVDEVGQPDG